MVMPNRPLLAGALLDPANNMKKNLFKILILVALMFSALITSQSVLAQPGFDPDPPELQEIEVSGFQKSFTKFFGSTVEQVYETEQFQEGLLEQQLPTAIGRVINVVLGFLGLMMLILFIYAGLLWVTAGGNTDQVDRAKMFIKNAIIGMILALAAFIITAFVVTTVENALEKKASADLHRLV